MNSSYVFPSIVLLGELVLNSVNQFPNARHILIGHSHGGNVALGAVDSERMSSVGVVCLSTPILHAVPRTAMTDSDKFMVLLWVLGLVGMLVFGEVYSKSQTLTVYVVCFLTMALLLRLENYRNHSLELMKAVNTPRRVDPEMVLFLRSIGDEATFALAAFQALQWVMNNINEWLLSLYSIVLKIFKWIFKNWILALVLLIPVVIWSMAIMTFFGHRNPNLGDAAAFAMVVVLMGVLFVPMLTPLVSALLLVNGFLLVLIGILPFGFRLASATLWFELCVESQPPGRWKSLVLEPAKYNRRGLRHSFCYQDHRTISAIARHMSDLDYFTNRFGSRT